MIVMLGRTIAASLAATLLALASPSFAQAPSGKVSIVTSFSKDVTDPIKKAFEASGVKFDQPYNMTRHKSFASATFTDPWGVSIEVTEGLSGL